jgi:hypothetical protein
MLKTREANQKELTESFRGVPVESKENWRVVAVTAEKKVATVDRLSLDNEIKLCHIDVWRRSLREVSIGERVG